MKMMDTFWMLFLLSLLSGRVFGHTLPQNLEKPNKKFSWSCSEAPASTHNPSSVHSLRPADITVFSVVGLTHTPNVMSSIISSFQDVMSMFSPEFTSVLPDDVPSGLVNQAEQAVSLLNTQQPYIAETGWKLVIIFVTVDRQCMCAEEVTIVAQEVDAAVQVLHSQVKKAIISVVIQDSEPYSQHGRICSCLSFDSDEDLRLTGAIYSHALLEYLKETLSEKDWYSRDDFTVVLQDIPLFSDAISNTYEWTSEENLNNNQANTLFLQLWENLLQPNNMQEKLKNGDVPTVQCQTQHQPFLRTEKNSPSRGAVPTLDTGREELGVNKLWGTIKQTQRKFKDANHPTSQGFGQGEDTGGSRGNPQKMVTGTEMHCEDMSPSNTIPTSVHTVRPADIRVVGAVGDSLTAGNGVASTNLVAVLTQYRGLSWSIGGDSNLSTVTTLPNIMRVFNPELTGFSVRTGKQNTKQAFLNQAVAGAKSSDILGQAEALVKRMKTDNRINFYSDWKVITMFIGGNDFCDSCIKPLYYSPENFMKRIQVALDFLHSEIPRVIVNLVEPLHIIPLRVMHQNTTLGCPTWLVRILCPCVVTPEDGSEALQDLEDLNRAYQRVLKDLVESGRYDTHSNFTVVLQPFLRDIAVPMLDGRPDRSFFSPDCFHLSQKAHTLMARALWNNMMEELGNKTHRQDFFLGLQAKCPSQISPFLQTFENSNYTYKGPLPPPPPITNWGSDFSCTDTKPSINVPSSVHRLRPTDIKVIAALGDSFTAALGTKSKNYTQFHTEYKGVSWSIGGDHSLDMTTTLPNILRQFNPSLWGFSNGDGLSAQDGFNMAVSGATASDLVDQVNRLIQGLKSSESVDFEMDWKLITVLIGVNDLCKYCMDQNNLSPQNYSHHLMKALDLLYKEVPRVLVNVLTVPEIEALRMVRRSSLGCSFFPRDVCPCFMTPADNSSELIELKLINHEYQTQMEQLISGERYDGREDFTVVLQPYLQNTTVPLDKDGKPDLSYFTLDCFHFSERAQAEMAISLWNNMLEPVGNKTTFNNFTYDRTKLRCPSETLRPFIYTKMNSHPDYFTTPEPTSASTSQPQLTAPCPKGVPVWVPAIFGIIGLFLGWGVTWLFMRRWIKKQKSEYKLKEKETEVKGTNL
ncbi:phospholipase B1, membrane-associated-like isoform X2 [Tachysurus fulvidraco]|uniref:phospholipase B1, membrane-associated-like isoform X2 n=1 Tax=Tachysurus fulvidraco TaxID=1234273 RepID=UPI001FEF4FEC|nr:phospholipase B1, membrane-associated-like isoform X2 [Tachysurus fulvidraco]